MCSESFESQLSILKTIWRSMPSTLPGLLDKNPDFFLMSSNMVCVDLGHVSAGYIFLLNESGDVDDLRYHAIFYSVLNFGNDPHKSDFFVSFLTRTLLDCNWNNL